MLRAIGWKLSHSNGAPMPNHAVLRAGGSKASLGSDEVPASQNFHCGRHRAFRQAGGFGYVAQARFHGSPTRLRSPAIKIKVSQKRRRSFVMTDQVTQQYIQHVNIYGHEALLSRHPAKVGLSF